MTPPFHITNWPASACAGQQIASALKGCQPPRPMIALAIAVPPFAIEALKGLAKQAPRVSFPAPVTEALARLAGASPRAEVPSGAAKALDAALRLYEAQSEREGV